MSKDPKKIFGLWISDTAMTAVEMFETKLGPQVMNYSDIELPPGIIESGCIVIQPDLFREVLNKLLLEAKYGPIICKNALIALPEEKTFSHLIEVPKEKGDDEEYIVEAARDLIPIELDEAAIDYHIIRESDDGKTVTLNFVAAQANIVNSLVSTLKESGINVFGVDTSSNCLLRACENPKNINSGAILIASLDGEKTFISLTAKNGSTFSDSVNIGGLTISEKIRTALGLSSTAEARAMISCLKKDIAEKLTDEQKQTIETVLKGDFEALTGEIKKLNKTLINETNEEVQTIYPTGCFSSVPGFTKALAMAFPNAKIQEGLEYLQKDVLNHACYMVAIGLAIKPYLANEKTDLNLLPKSKKEELRLSEATPKLKRYLLEISLLLSASMLLFGMYLAKTYVNFKVSEQKALVLNEKALNPYLTEIVKAEQQKQQMNNQVLGLVEKSLPVSKIIGDLDNFNTESLAMINISFSTNAATHKNQLRARAKASSRAETELFVAKLNEVGYYSEIISPLSNLVGKGDRFINVDLSIDPAKLTEIYRHSIEQEKTQMLNEIEEEASSPKTPASPKIAQPEEEAVTDEIVPVEPETTNIPNEQ